MRLHRFVGATSREVMRQVREALGADALIVSSRAVPAGMEVLASAEAELREGVVQAETAIPHAQPVVCASSVVAAPDASPARPDPVAQPATAAPFSPAHPFFLANAPIASSHASVAGLLFQCLLEAGFSMPLARALAQRIPPGMDKEAALAWARNELVMHLPVLRDEPAFLQDGGIYALVGPTGVGKTTTLAKLAARFVAREGKDQVAMLTTDLFRIGAAEQLQIYGRLLDVPAQSVRDERALRQALAALGHRRVILIDTTGLSQRDRRLAEQMAMLHGAGRPVHRLLVLDAASQGDTLDEVARAYRDGADQVLAGCILSKLDECRRVASALDTVIRYRLPIHYVSDGQRVPEDLRAAQAQDLVDRAFAPVGQGPALYTPSAADLALLWQGHEHALEAQAAERRRMLVQGLASRVGDARGVARALAWLETDAACDLARTYWRAGQGSRQANGRTDIDMPALRDEALAHARRHYVQGCDRYLLAFHGQVVVRGSTEQSASLSSAVLMTDGGVAVGAPLSQWRAPHGSVATYTAGDARAQTAVSASAQPLRQSIHVLDEALHQVPQVHVIEAGGVGLWRALSDAGIAWMARVPGMQRLVQAGCITTASSVARALGYKPVQSTRATTLWVAGTEIEVPMRGSAALPLRLLCVRQEDPATGNIVRQWYGLTRLAVSQVEAATLARWLVWHVQVKPAFRLMGHAWSALDSAAFMSDAAWRVLLASQLGVACRQAQNGPDAVHQLLSNGRRLTEAALPAALLRGFAMLEI